MSHEPFESQTTLSTTSTPHSRSLGKFVVLAAAFGIASALVLGLKFHSQVRADSSGASAQKSPDRFLVPLSPDGASSSQPAPKQNSDRLGEELRVNSSEQPRKNVRTSTPFATSSNSAHSASANTAISSSPQSDGEQVNPHQKLNFEKRQFEFKLEDKIQGSNPEIAETSRDRLPTQKSDNPSIVASVEQREPETVDEQIEELEVIERTEDLDILEANDRAIELTLADTVILALQNNRDLKNAYLERILERQDLAVAEDRFNPNFTPEFSVQLDRDFSGESLTNSEVIQIGGGINWRIPTGGTFSVNLQGLGNARRQSGVFRSDRNSLDSNFEVTFRQPFLRNFGTDVNRAPIEMARLVEVANIWDLKSTLIDTITNAVSRYRELLQAQQQLKIEERALESARAQLERTQALIEAGRTARVERVPNETAIANREVSLLNAQNRLQTQQLSLIEVLDINQRLVPIAIEVPQSDRLEEISFNEEELLQVALVSSPSYQQTLLQRDREQLQLLIAENDRLWNLDLETRFTGDLSSDLSDRTDFRVGIALSREFGNLSREQAVERTQIAIQQLENDIEEARESLEIDVRNGIRDVRDNFRQVQLARRARELSAQQLANEQRRLELGRGSIIEVVRFEDALVRAENGELNATVSYLNALTLLEQTIGTTLEAWNVTLESGSGNEPSSIGDG